MKINIVETLKKLNKIITYLFVILLIIIFPFYMKEGYSNIGYAKWAFFRFLTLGTILDDIYYPGLLLIATSIEIVINLIDIFKYRKKIVFHKIDKYVFSYYFFVILSTIFSYNNWYAIHGYNQFWMGLFAQIGFIMTYYFVSRYFKLKKNYLYIFIVVTSIVYLLEVLNRFWIFIPRSSVYGLIPNVIVRYVSTIGNINWYASYMSITIPLSIVLFVFSYDKKLRLVSLFSLIIISASFVTQNSQSLIAGLIMLYVFMLFEALKKKDTTERFLLSIIVMFISFKIIGLLRKLFPIRCPELDSIFEFMMNNNFMMVLLALIILIFISVRYAIKEENFNIVKRIIKYFFIVLAIGIIIIVTLNNIGVINLGVSLLKFDDTWGNNRGEIWRLTLLAIIRMLKDSPLRFIYGGGPDNYKDVIYYYCQNEVYVNWFNVTLANAHNEWLNAIVNYGIVGGLSYLIIYLKGIRLSNKNKDNIVLWFIACMLICYMTNNFFSFQQAVSTPLAFFLFGIIEKEENQIDII